MAESAPRAPGTASSAARGAWYAAGLVAAVALAVRLPAFFASRHLHVDDGVYGVSTVDMRHGLTPYRGVFSSQGPLHLPLLYVGDLIGFRTLNAPRVTPVVAGIVASIGVWAIARRLGARPWVAVTAGLLVATTGSMLWTTAPITGDGPAAAFVVGALWCALAYRDDPRVWRALLAGALFGAALAVKPLAAPAVIPIAAWLGARRDPRALVGAGVSAVVVWFAAALPFGLANVWDQSIEYNTGAGPTFSTGSQAQKLVETLLGRDLILVALVVIGAACAIAAARRPPTLDDDDASPHRRTDTTVLLIWLAAVVVALVFEKALYRNHLAAVVVPLTLLFALHPPPRRWTIVVIVVLVPVWFAQLDDILWPRPAHGITRQAHDALRALPRGARAISDDPGFVWRAGLSTPRLMNDGAQKRIDQRLLTTENVSAAAAEPDTCAVLIWSDRFGEQLPGLRDELVRLGYEPTVYDTNRELWLKPRCDPGGQGDRTSATGPRVRSHD